MSGKLVRDKIPEIIRANGEKPIVRRARSQGEYAARLLAKLREEVQEYITGSGPEELADILEVVYTLAAQDGISPQRLEEMRAAKERERGGFAGMVVWLGNEAGGRQ